MYYDKRGKPMKQWSVVIKRDVRYLKIYYGRLFRMVIDTHNRSSAHLHKCEEAEYENIISNIIEVTSESISMI